MANTSQPDNPAYKCAAAQKQCTELEIIRDLSAGTPRMRERGEVYLPKEAGEGSIAYNVRRSRSLLFNTYVKVREGLIGIALKKNPELESDVPTPLEQHFEDIDLNGNHLDVFIKDVFRSVIDDGHAFILVDMQPPLPFSVTSAASIPDASDEIAAGRRPYWVKRRKDEAINWKYGRVNGRIALTQITFEERVTKSDGAYSEKEVIRYRVLRLPLLAPESPGRPAIYGTMEWELFEKVVTDDKKEDLILVDGNTTDLVRIPVVPIYSRRTGFLESQPPLLDLAYLNVGHWQQWSDLNCQIRMLVPILEIRGELAHTEVAPAEAGKPANARQPKIAVGPGAALHFKDNEGGVDYKSADASATQGMREALTDLEQRMSAVGLSIISPKPDQVGQATTATEKVLDQDERTSELASWLRALKDGIEAAMEIHAVDYLGLETGGSIILGFDEADPVNSQAVMAVEAPKGVVPGQMPPQSAEMMQ